MRTGVRVNASLASDQYCLVKLQGALPTVAKYWDVLAMGGSEVGWAGDVLDALAGVKTEIAEEGQQVIAAMGVLADEPEGSARTVARALANRVLKDGLKVKTEDGQSPHKVLSEALGWYLGVDITYGWSATQATAKG